ncbi:hypothetical protein CEUSTIGMA_g7001.t1 [Chlamydomonas eustigma]|uniref:Uncharacterized protein n=1 Tax=Chlamydomonas eustigma TaxID=1157962 RepID=A0A250X9W7_9CHLO|nr:hypothetical protein CEUSTIGMA_g7001.t1 [Chlamydomonas eustigma]|eukprot:GAX79560.1 hypothetical protein CEUSTIGMA_g7001.t1 [Chlamydomonas eustigma]
MHELGLSRLHSGAFIFFILVFNGHVGAHGDFLSFLQHNSKTSFRSVLKSSAIKTAGQDAFKLHHRSPPALFNRVVVKWFSIFQRGALTTSAHSPEASSFSQPTSIEEGDPVTESYASRPDAKQLMSSDGAADLKAVRQTLSFSDVTSLSDYSTATSTSRAPAAEPVFPFCRCSDYTCTSSPYLLTQQSFPLGNDGSLVTLNFVNNTLANSTTPCYSYLLDGLFRVSFLTKPRCNASYYNVLFNGAAPQRQEFKSFGNQVGFPFIVNMDDCDN